MGVATVLQTRESLYDNRAGELNGTTTALLVLATAFVGLRFWARYLNRASYGSDDWMMVAALIVVFISGAINYAMVAHGLGRHADTLPIDELVTFFKLLLAFECIYVTTVMLVKLSVLQMYLRIFPSRGFKIAAAIIAALVVAWWIAIVAVCIFQCNPISKAWLPWIDGTCIDLKGSFIGNAIPNIVTDVAILCMPIRQVWKLHVTLAQRLSLCFMFLLGSFVLFSSIYRFTTIMQFDTRDTTWTLATACTWCVVEVACGVISGCLPTLRPLMGKISSQFGSMTNSKAGQGSGNSRAWRPTELITIGGTGGSKSGDRYFQRLGTEEDKYRTRKAITRSESVSKQIGHSSDPGSGDELPVNGGIRDKNNLDMEIQWQGQTSNKWESNR
ncbi:hypothetical protein BGZ61DRAFT_463569 [Ilyonectria robusta]|uniref:uncharacterized protein n=1 Tax=Ilyonectria robusta TaxID=1079257 RepID=UPI001E8D5DFE|nr:uncharacterized protein BGZ61DRAFT_463569 [Ilyonectria robusta]KAH8661746.1 hypothetical protein BGZ61DRAFT_463569 [Ilyonectria robusta]